MPSAKSTGHVLKQLRQFMCNKQHVSECVHAYIIPSGDAHQSEYIAPCHKRREFISGFTGSAGTAIVTQNEALLWTDGRYFLQAEKELDHNWTLMRDGVGKTLKREEWLSQKLPEGAVVGVDPYLLSLDDWRIISQELKNSGKSLIRVDHNLVDLVWSQNGQPEEPCSELIALGEEFSGKQWQKKIQEIQEKLKSKDVYGVVIAALDEVAWLFNLRGSDISYNPVFMSYAIVTLDGASLFIDEARLSSQVIHHLQLSNQTVDLKVLSYTALQEEVRVLGKLSKKIWISSKCSCALASLIPEKYLVTDISPVCMAKAVKNEVEINGMKNAHVRDAAALCEYLCWLEEQVHYGNITELTAAEKLDSLRSEQENFVSLSFETISASGPNAAVIHYRPEAPSARTVHSDDMYLCDSGGQYLDGTTDITRTVHFGTPTVHQKKCFTRVLKGHIQLATMVFPKGTRGHVLDVFARKALWDSGLDYLHGTGHGVGAFLNVHEGPIGISPRVSNDQPLEAGMFLSDEPGYYEDGAFGIRIENVIFVKDVTLEHNFQNKGFLGFEVVSLVPIQRKLLIPEMLTKQEITWLNDYHSMILEKVGSYLKQQGKHKILDWLIRETECLG